MMVEEPYRPGVMEYMNYFSSASILNLLKEYGFNTKTFEREATTSENELGQDKLVVFASNNKHRKFRRLNNK